MIQELRLIDRTRRRFRFYQVGEALSLFGEPALFVTWGRIGAPHYRTRCECFADRRALERRLRALLARRRRHGYVDASGAPPSEAFALPGRPPAKDARSLTLPGV